MRILSKKLWFALSSLLLLSSPGEASQRKGQPLRVPEPKGGKRPAHLPVTSPALLARSKSQPLAKNRLPVIQMEHLNTHAQFLLRPDLKGGGFSTKQMRALSDFLRCHHTRKRRAMDARLLSLVYATARHYGNAKIWVIAGYRAPEVAREKGNPKSPHKQGVACDFRLEGVALPELRDYLKRTYQHVGVGFYPKSNFVHLDVGRVHNAYWTDFSGPGERARYTPEPEAEPGAEITAEPAIGVPLLMEEGEAPSPTRSHGG